MGPEPPPAPAVPAAGAVMLPTRFQTIEATDTGTCGISGRPIFPRNLICQYAGAWCLFEQAVRFDDHRQAAGNQRRADQERAACFEAWIDCVPVAA